MDDNVSRGSSSNDSILAALDFEIINPIEPQLNIAGNGNLDDLKRSMSEVLMDNHSVITRSKSDTGNASPQLKNATTIEKNEEIKMDSNKLSKNEKEKIEIDIFAGGEHVQLGPKITEEGDVTLFTMTPCDDDFNYICQSMGSMGLVTLPDGDECTLFNKVTYLGAATINAPKSENEIQRNIEIFNSQSLDQAIEITLSVPSSSDGSVVLFEPNSSVQIACFKIVRIIFCIGGIPDSASASCFAFTCTHGEIGKSTLFYQCQIFKCDTQDTVTKILKGFRNVFQRGTSVQSIPEEPMKESTPEVESTNEEMFIFEVTLEIREEDAKGNYNASPKDKDSFKLRCNLMKKLVLVVQQISNNKELPIEKCFGLLISPGRNVKNNDMHLVESVSTTTSAGDPKSYFVTGVWDPCDPIFEILNVETPKDSRIHMTLAMDLSIKGIQEPVRFWMETKAKIFPQNDRFWYFTRKQLVEQFHLQLKETISSPDKSSYEVISLKSVPVPEVKKLQLNLNRNPTHTISPPVSTPGDREEDTDNDEPLLSGSGEVSKDCNPVELGDWTDVLTKWQQDQSCGQRSRQIVNLVRRGIPEPLRAEVWPRLVGIADSSELMEQYRTLISKDSPCEPAIQRDINRTFPAHDYFKTSGGIGQELLYKICKVYSIYDDEVGYCQGLSFLAASLLLHMPEEQTFCVLVKIMYDYQLRDLFKDNFKVLHLRFFQLEKMIEDQLSDLYTHFMNLGIEAHMYGSQWFLTLFTAKFPLFLVFHILDIFLCEGMDTIFQVALALLSMSRKDLLSLDFEGVLKYFRVALPKKFRSEETARQLLRTAVQIKTKKLKKYQKDFEVFKEQERQLANPTERLERENKRLMEANMRLEQENDDLAHELVTSKIQLRNELDVSEDKADALNKELLSTKSLLIDTEEEKKRLEIEATQLKEMCRRELQRAESDGTRNTAIISDYKQICSQLSIRLEKEQAAAKKAINQLHEEIKECDKCSKLLDTATKGSVVRGPLDGDPKLADALDQIRELELELAQTKLALVEAECRNQDLNHQLNTALSELQASKNTWFHKTISSIRDATKKDSLSRESSKDGT
uniref:Rab-GAP TBC domain-containing protein n=1 Tax=Strigamia maritima TaxID=126957 RepID=T1J7L1_STRMM